MVLCGVSNTEAVLQTFGISRFMHNGVHPLEGLTNEDRQSVIRDWLVFDGGANEEDFAPLVDIIAQECHGWPQHIVAFCGETVGQNFAILCRFWASDSIKNARWPAFWGPEGRFLPPE